MKRNFSETDSAQQVLFDEHDRVVIQRVIDAGSEVGKILFNNIDPKFLAGRAEAVGMTGHVFDVLDPTMGTYDQLIRSQSVYIVSYDGTVQAGDGNRYFGGCFVAEELGAADAPAPLKP